MLRRFFPMARREASLASSRRFSRSVIGRFRAFFLRRACASLSLAFIIALRFFRSSLFLNGLKRGALHLLKGSTSGRTSPAQPCNHASTNNIRSSEKMQAH